MVTRETQRVQLGWLNVTELLGDCRVSSGVAGCDELSRQDFKWKVL